MRFTVLAALVAVCVGQEIVDFQNDDEYYDDGEDSVLERPSDVLQGGSYKQPVQELRGRSSSSSRSSARSSSGRSSARSSYSSSYTPPSTRSSSTTTRRSSRSSYSSPSSSYGGRSSYTSYSPSTYSRRSYGGSYYSGAIAVDASGLGYSYGTANVNRYQDGESSMTEKVVGIFYPDVTCFKNRFNNVKCALV